MKTFRDIREASAPKGDVVFDKKINRVPVKITKTSKGFVLFVFRYKSIAVLRVILKIQVNNFAFF